MDDLSSIVLPNGALDCSLLLKKEEISSQINVGRLSLTRFWMRTQTGIQSFIFKPTKEITPIEIELIFQKDILPHMNNVRVPKLIAHRMDNKNSIYWMIFEDVGKIDPSFTPAVRIRAAQKMAEWHSLPKTTITPAFKSYMPYIDDTLRILLQNKEHYEKLLHDIGIDCEKVSAFWGRLASLNGTFPSEKVVCHGDFHCMNLLVTADDLVILDWEFIQINSVYWDFYTLLDMATPRYRIQINAEVRKAAINVYVEERMKRGWVPANDFIHGYHLYSLIYSVWILGLLNEDIKAERYDVDTLRIQVRELTEIISDCLSVVLVWPD